MQDINIYQLFKFYARKWLWIISFTALGALAGYIYNTYIQVPLYKSDATLLIVSTEDRKVGQDSTLINNYIELIKSRRVLEPVLEQKGYDLSYEELVASTSASNNKDTEVIKLSIDSNDSKMSKNIADGVLASFKKEVKTLYNVDNVSVVDNANENTTPYNVHTTAQMTLTTLGGFLGSIALLFFVYDFSQMKKKARVQLKNKVILVKPRRQGGLVNKIVDMIIGTEVKSN